MAYLEFIQLDLYTYVNMDSISYVNFTEEEDDDLGSSLLVFRLFEGSEFTFSILELAEDNVYYSIVLKALDKLGLFSLISAVKSIVAVLKKIKE